MIFGQTRAPRPHPEVGAAYDALKRAPLLFAQRRAPQRGFGVHERDGKRPPAEFGGSMTYQDRVVANDAPGGIGLKDFADTDHAQRMQLSRAQGPQTGAPRDRNAARDQVEYFLVPDGRRYLETAIDQTDRGRRIHDQGRQIATDGRWPHVDRLRDKRTAEAWSHEQDRPGVADLPMGGGECGPGERRTGCALEIGQPRPDRTNHGKIGMRTRIFVQENWERRAPLGHGQQRLQPAFRVSRRVVRNLRPA